MGVGIGVPFRRTPRPAVAGNLLVSTSQVNVEAVRRAWRLARGAAGCMLDATGIHTWYVDYMYAGLAFFAVRISHGLQTMRLLLGFGIET